MRRSRMIPTAIPSPAIAAIPSPIFALLIRCPFPRDTPNLFGAYIRSRDPGAETVSHLVPGGCRRQESTKALTDLRNPCDPSPLGPLAPLSTPVGPRSGPPVEGPQDPGATAQNGPMQHTHTHTQRKARLPRARAIGRPAGPLSGPPQDPPAEAPLRPPFRPPSGPLYSPYWAPLRTLVLMQVLIGRCAGNVRDSESRTVVTTGVLRVRSQLRTRMTSIILSVREARSRAPPPPGLSA